MKKLAATAMGLITAGLLAGGSLVACGVAVSSVSVNGGVVTADTRQGGGQALAIALRPPKAASFAAQSIVHRWTASDVTEYDVTLNVGTGSGMNALSTVQIFPKDSQPETEAIFSHLKVGVPYVVSVLAKGNKGGNPAETTQVLNTQNPADALVLFSGYSNNDINNAKTVSVQVQLDNVAFSGTATVSITTADGSYSAPVATESGSAD